MTKQEEKQRLRRTMRTLERQLPEKYKAASSRAICAHLLAMPEYQAAAAVFCFVGTAREIDTRPILADALAVGKRLSVPRCTGPGVMELRQIRSFDELVPGAYGILEPPMTAPLTDPDDVDLAILPCLQPPGPAAGSGRRLLRPLSLQLPGRNGAAVPGKAHPGGNSPGAPRLPHSLGADGGGPV